MKTITRTWHKGTRMHNETDSTKNTGHVFYKDMRFWLIIAMLSAFLAFILVRFPG